MSGFNDKAFDRAGLYQDRQDRFQEGAGARSTGIALGASALNGLRFPAEGSPPIKRRRPSDDPKTWRDNATYKNATEMFAEEQKRSEGTETYRKVVEPRGSTLCIVAPHGGPYMETGTDQCAKLLSRANGYSLYVLEALTPSEDQRLHVTSAQFDDPECLELIGTAQTVITIHARTDPGIFAAVGGRDTRLKRRLLRRFAESNLPAALDEIYPGKHPNNLCNRGQRKCGVQIEFSRDLSAQFVCLYESNSAPESSGESSGQALQYLKALKAFCQDVERWHVAHPLADRQGSPVRGEAVGEGDEGERRRMKEDERG